MSKRMRSSVIGLVLVAMVLGGSSRGEARPKRVTSPSADVGVHVHTYSKTIAPGEEARFDVFVSNNGPSAATAITVENIIGGPATVVGTSSPHATCSGSSTTTCSVSELGPYASTQFSVQVRATGVGTVTSEARASADQPDPDLSNNSASASFGVSDNADVGVWAGTAPTDADTPGVMTYTIGNGGPAPAPRVRVLVTATSGALVVAAPGVCIAAAATDTWICEFGTLAKYKTANIQVTLGSARHTIYDDTVIYSGYGSSRVEVVSDAPDPNRYNNVAEQSSGSQRTLPTCVVTCRIPRP